MSHIIPSSIYLLTARHTGTKEDEILVELVFPSLLCGFGSLGLVENLHHGTLNPVGSVRKATTQGPLLFSSHVIFFFFFFFVFLLLLLLLLLFLGPLPRYMEVPRLGVESEL